MAAASVRDARGVRAGARGVRLVPGVAPGDPRSAVALDGSAQTRAEPTVRRPWPVGRVDRTDPSRVPGMTATSVSHGAFAGQAIGGLGEVSSYGRTRWTGLPRIWTSHVVTSKELREVEPLML